MESWRGGRLVGSNGNTPVRTAGTQDLWLGFDGANGSDLIDIDFFYVWGTQLPTQVIQAFSLLPFQVFQNHHVQSFATSVAVSYPYLAGGGIQFGGAAGARRTFSHRFLPSSGLRLGGAATIARSIVHPFRCFAIGLGVRLRADRARSSSDRPPDPEACSSWEQLRPGSKRTSSRSPAAV